MIPKKYKAALRDKYGPPETIRIEAIPLSPLKNHQALVRVQATTINRTDQGVLRGKPFVFRFFTGMPHPKIKVLGTDFSGEIIEKGKDFKGFEIGDRVMGFRDEGLGSQAELLKVDSNVAMVKIPETIDFEKAAASLEGFHYAYTYFKAARNPKKIFINGGTGAIGSAAIQIFKANGSMVSASSGKKHLDQIKSLGADHVFNYENLDFKSLSKDYDVFLDSVGKLNFKIAKQILKPRGIYMSSELGPYKESLFLPLLTRLRKGKIMKFPIPKNIQESIETAAIYLQEGKIHPLIERTYSLQEIKKAYQHMESGEKIGNLILDLDP